MTLVRFIKKIVASLTISSLICVEIGLAQSAASQALDINTSNYDRIIGQTIESIFPPPTGNYDVQKYQNQYNKTALKLRGEANEELVTSLMALAATYTPASANDLAEIISRSNTFLTNEQGAVNATAILQTGLDQLKSDIDNLSNLDDDIQIEVLTKHLESIVLIKQAILNKLNRYMTYTINEQSSSLITSETNYFNLCSSGTPPTQNGITTIVGFLTDTYANNQTTMINLTNTINTDLGIYPLAQSTTIAEIDVLINDPGTTSLQIISLETIKANMETKAQLIQDNLDINACNTEIIPKVAEVPVIKTDEDTYLSDVMNSILDTGASIQLPALPTNYNTFDISNVCTTPLPPSVATEVSTVKSNCTTWINYYKAPYTIANVNTDPPTAIADLRYNAISNCGKAGRTCSAATMERLGNEIKALGVFPIGRLIVAEMILQSVDLAVLFYNDLLYSPQLYDCEQINNPNLLTQLTDRKNCHRVQRESLICAIGIGIDCDRAEIGYQLNLLKISSDNQNLTETSQNGASNQGNGNGQTNTNSSGEIAFGPGTNSETGGDKTTSPISFTSTNINDENTNQLNQGAGVTDNKSSKNQATDFAENTAFNNLTLSKLGAKLTGRGSFRIVNDFFREKFKLNKKLKRNFKNKSSDAIANDISKNFSKTTLEKFSNSYGGKENLFASAKLNNGIQEKNIRGSQAAKVATTSYRPKKFQVNYRFRPSSTNITRQKDANDDGPELSDEVLEIEAYPGSSRYKPKKYLAKIHSNKIGLFEIISRRFRRTDIYFNNTY